MAVHLISYSKRVSRWLKLPQSISLKHDAMWLLCENVNGDGQKIQQEMGRRKFNFYPRQWFIFWFLYSWMRHVFNFNLIFLPTVGNSCCNRNMIGLEERIQTCIQYKHYYALLLFLHPFSSSPHPMLSFFLFLPIFFSSSLFNETAPPGSCRPQVGPTLAPWTLLSGGSTQRSLLLENIGLNNI